MADVENRRDRGRSRAYDRAIALERAMVVFWAYGYDGAAMSMLTQAMGISAQSLYTAFGSKEALYREAINLYRATIGGFAARALDEEEDVLAALGRLLHEAAHVFADTAGAPGCMITTAPDTPADGTLTTFGRELREQGVLRVAQRIERGRRDGQVRTDADAAAWAGFIGSIVQGMSVQARDGASIEALRSTATLAVQALHGLRPD